MAEIDTPVAAPTGLPVFFNYSYGLDVVGLLRDADAQRLGSADQCVLTPLQLPDAPAGWTGVGFVAEVSNRAQDAISVRCLRPVTVTLSSAEMRTESVTEIPGGPLSAGGLGRLRDLRRRLLATPRRGDDARGGALRRTRRVAAWDGTTNAAAVVYWIAASLKDLPQSGGQVVAAADAVAALLAASAEEQVALLEEWLDRLGAAPASAPFPLLLAMWPIVGFSHTLTAAEAEGAGENAEAVLFVVAEPLTPPAVGTVVNGVLATRTSTEADRPHFSFLTDVSCTVTSATPLMATWRERPPLPVDARATTEIDALRRRYLAVPPEAAATDSGSRQRAQLAARVAAVDPVGLLDRIGFGVAKVSPIAPGLVRAALAYFALDTVGDRIQLVQRWLAGCEDVTLPIRYGHLLTPGVASGSPDAAHLVDGLEGRFILVPQPEGSPATASAPLVGTVVTIGTAHPVVITGAYRVHVTAITPGDDESGEQAHFIECAALPGDDPAAAARRTIAAYLTWVTKLPVHTWDEATGPSRWLHIDSDENASVRLLTSIYTITGALPTVATWYSIDDLTVRFDAITDWLETATAALAKDGGLAARVGAMALPDNARPRIEREVARYLGASAGSSEASASMTYLAAVAALPWTDQASPPTTTLDAARAVLDSSHAGMDGIKDRVLDHLAALLWWARRREQTPAGGTPPPPPPLRPLLMVGPPGVGKTSILKSMGVALDRQVEIIACGGLTESAALDGFESTYVGSHSGAIIDAVLRARSRQFVLCFDEIDKMTASSNGDPFAILMAITDPMQNDAFTDRFLGFPFDLSRLFIVATANDVARIPSALIDRFELIEVRGYSPEEKVTIARSHLLPRTYVQVHAAATDVGVADDALALMVQDYTYEAGVRELSGLIETVVLRRLREIMAGQPLGQVLDAAYVRGHLGQAEANPAPTPMSGGSGYGTIIGVDPTMGGGLSGIEVSLRSKPSAARWQLTSTGSGGDDTWQCMQVAHAYVAAHAAQLGIDQAVVDNNDVHLHLDWIEMHKSGPSLGLAVLIALVSAMTGRATSPGITMTGQVTLDGRVLTVGGVPDKIVAAHRAGATRVLIPTSNLSDIANLPADVRGAIEITPVSTVDDALQFALPSVTAPAAEPSSAVAASGALSGG